MTQSYTEITESTTFVALSDDLLDEEMIRQHWWSGTDRG